MPKREWHPPQWIDAESAQIKKALRKSLKPRCRVGAAVSASNQTVATGVTGEPTLPGKRSGGAVNRKALR